MHHIIHSEITAGCVGFGWIGFRMTKNRAQKRAARERALLTGEPYVVARRNTIDHAAAPAPRPALPRPVAALHRLTHLVPGVPPHPDSARATAGRATAHPRFSSRPNPVHVQPAAPGKRVLVGWQTWIEHAVRGK